MARAYAVEGTRTRRRVRRLWQALGDDRRLVRLKLSLVAVLYLCAATVARGG